MNTTKTVSDSLSRIKNEIAKGVFAGGSRITEATISELSNISRTPAREVIRILIEQGILEATPNRGARVKLIRTDEVMQIYELRLQMEPYIARLATPLITSSTINELEMLCNFASLEVDTLSCDLAQDRNFWKFNEQIHYCFFDAYGNYVFKEILQILWNRLLSVQLLEFNDPLRIKNVLQEHKQILDALKDKDKDTVVKRIENHLVVSRDNMCKKLQDKFI